MTNPGPTMCSRGRPRVFDEAHVLDAVLARRPRSRTSRRKRWSARPRVRSTGAQLRDGADPTARAVRPRARAAQRRRGPAPGAPVAQRAPQRPGGVAQGERPTGLDQLFSSVGVCRTARRSPRGAPYDVTGDMDAGRGPTCRCGRSYAGHGSRSSPCAWIIAAYRDAPGARAGERGSAITDIADKKTFGRAQFPVVDGSPTR